MTTTNATTKISLMKLASPINYQTKTGNTSILIIEKGKDAEKEFANEIVKNRYRKY